MYRARACTTSSRLRFLVCLELNAVLWSDHACEHDNNERHMNEFLRDMAAVAVGVIIGGLVLLAVYDYYHNVYLASAPAGG